MDLLDKYDTIQQDGGRTDETNTACPKKNFKDDILQSFRRKTRNICP